MASRSTSPAQGLYRGPRKHRLASLLIIVVLALPFVGVLCPGDSFAAQIGREAIDWLCALGLVGFVLLVERRPLSSIGWHRPTWKTGAFGIAGAAVMVAGMAAIYLVIFPILGFSANEPTMASIHSMPLWFRVCLVLRAAVFEEVFYRGFMIERLNELTQLRWLGALLSLVAFPLAHANGWGWAHLMIAGFGGIVLTALYVVRRDLASNMLAHFLTDAVAFLVG